MESVENNIDLNYKIKIKIGVGHIRYYCEMNYNRLGVLNRLDKIVDGEIYGNII